MNQWGCLLYTSQGVGFRYKMYYLAQKYNATGWVQNECNGSVTAQVQGEEVSIDMILQALFHDRYISIEQMDVKELPLVAVSYTHLDVYKRQALDHTMEKYPLFQVVLRKGLFWFYLERRDIRAVAKKEVKPPCSRLYIPDKKSLLFEVRCV